MPFAVCDLANPSLGEEIAIWFKVALALTAYVGAGAWLVLGGRGRRWRLALAFVAGAVVPSIVLWREPSLAEERFDTAFLAATLAAMAAAALTGRQAAPRAFLVAALGAVGALGSPFGVLFLGLSLGWFCWG